MILWVFIEFFRIKIVIGWLKNHCDLIITVGFDLSQNIRYLPIFTDIFSEILSHASVSYSLEISPKYREFSIFPRYL